MNLTKFYTFRHFMPACLFSLFLFFGISISQAQTTETFNYTGAVQNWTVPAGVTSVFIEVWGAQGQDAGIGGTGGLGGFASGNLAVIPGEILRIYVGGTQLGFNGGGTGGTNGNDQFSQPTIGTYGGRGGGASDVRQNGMALTDRVIVAGGGGGGGHNGVWPGCQVAGPAGNGGNGGGMVGSSGTAGVGTPCNCQGGGGAGGAGGNQMAGGTAGAYAGNTACLRPTWQIGADGALGMGGQGSIAYHNGTGGGGGGGGGYYGGGSGGNGSDTTPGGGGGGGSSYTGGVSNGAEMAGVRSGDGEIRITYTSCANEITFNYTGALQNWTVPAGVTQVTIQAKGAQGGTVTTGGYPGGLGADMTGDFAVTPGQILNIVVGGMGNPETYSSGGGGASGVGIGASTLIVAGGGGGINLGDQDYPERHATVNNSGNDGSSYFNSGGMGGNDGADNIFEDINISRGGRGWNSGNAGSFGLNGSSPNTSTTNGTFGIGGGGGSVGSSFCNCGGGGGGYSGGGSGNINSSGGGGGSYNAGTNQTNIGGSNTGDGMVVISYSNCAPPCVDNDMDGYTDCDGDCDDNNPNVNPGSSLAMSNVIYHNSSSVTVYWTTIQGSTNYSIRYRLQGSSDPWTEANSLRAWRRLYSLSPCTDYEVQFRNYKGGVWNCWSQNYYFTTTGCAKPFNGGVKGGATSAATPQSFVQLYPNPTNGSDVTVEISTPASQSFDWTLTDLSGKMLQSGNAELTAGFNQITIQSADLPAGVYFFKAPLADGMQVVKLVVQ